MKYLLFDGLTCTGTAVDTDKAPWYWREPRDERQQSQQTLYRSRKGRYYIETVWQNQWPTSYAEWITPMSAAAWLVHKGCNDLPEDLACLIDEASE